MAEKKLAVIARVGLSGHIEVWCDGTAGDLRDIEGVAGVWDYPVGAPCLGCFLVRPDPRYDVNEIVGEIIDKFSPEIPGAFKEERDES